MSMISLMDFAAVRAALGQRVADAKFLAKGRRNLAGATDDDSMLATDEAVELVPSVFHLTYEDRHGYISERVVTVRRVERRSAGFFVHGLCHLRNEPRCFAVERVQEGFDVTTGEVFDDPQQFFSTHPIFIDPRDPETTALKNCRHEINLLTVVGASDGLFDPDEQDALLVHVFDRNDHLALSEDRLRGILALVAPDHRAFESSLFQMSQFRAGDAQMLRRSLRRLVDADGVLSKEEQAFVSEIEARLAPRPTF